MVKNEKETKPVRKGLSGALKLFLEQSKNPAKFLIAQPSQAEKIKMLVKSLYDHSQSFDHGAGIKSYLDQLVVEEMDAEQIWQQLELRNEYLLNEDLSRTSQLLSMGSKRMQLVFKKTEAVDSSSNGACDPHVNRSADSSSEEESHQENNSPKVKTRVRKGKRSIVDDQFFKLEDMAKFLDEEDEREMRKQSGKPDKDSLIEIDYFSSNAGENDLSDGDGIKYSDFFDDDDGDSGNGHETNDTAEEESSDNDDDKADESSEAENNPNNASGDENSEDEVERNRRLRYELYNSAEDFVEKKNKMPSIPEPEPVQSEQETEEQENGPKSSFELRQEKLHKRIQKMEDQLLQDKPWQLKGEISADTRPQNSLLEEILEFESTTRPAPVITEETTMRLEDIIKQRIKNKVYDDVERKIRPPDNPREYRKQLVLDAEKSTQSLAQIYEKDYLKQLEKSNPNADENEPEEPKEHKEIRSAMKRLLAQLDALSNFRYTPRPAVPELKIITNTPAISMEEVAPVAISDAVLLAPEEVHNRPKGAVMSKDERTKSDKNRERRLKKRFQRDKFNRQAEKERKNLAKGFLPKTKEVQEKLLKKVSKAKNVSAMTETTGVGKSSSAFFSQLQDEVSTQIKRKLDPSDKKQNKSRLKATHVKL
ncbi:U3 small nucleolar ribonucleoprotein protein MPP10 [Malaya genurostris]|uniref:U3 small nucleolar ribonucleoprotein protein MPP10 n=1 Tax=Malaya genurostris TaxID=325434 RepID=UPI0026F3D6E9|nr:U3 small nucleolar ribonucleoprotein protein MPP10 [Malaya genurostris]